jgi:hypothetical protein
VKGHGQFPGSSITVPAHLVAKVREPDAVIAISEPDTMIVHVVPPKAEEPEPTAEGAAVVAATPATPAEPEVIKKGKVDKEEEK